MAILKIKPVDHTDSVQAVMQIVGQELTNRPLYMSFFLP